MVLAVQLRVLAVQLRVLAVQLRVLAVQLRVLAVHLRVLGVEKDVLLEDAGRVEIKDSDGSGCSHQIQDCGVDASVDDVE